MLLAILFGALTSLAIQGTISHPDCKARGFEPKACEVAKAMDRAGK